MRYINKFVLITSLCLSVPLWGQSQDQTSFPSLSKPLQELQGLDGRYQIGDEWGKAPVKTGDYKKVPSLEKIAKGTARLGGGTGFYLGKFDGEHVLATNHHVCPSSIQCRWTSAQFPLVNKRFSVKTFLGTWSDIDLALMTIKVDQADEDLLKTMANPFAFMQETYRGQELITVGFGGANNRSRSLVANFDSDCKVFSGSSEYRFMADPDSLNTGSYKAWSFANGCDVSHGDSGSAMVDRQSGEVVGIIWTGKIPKSDKVQDSDYLDELLEQPNEDIWTELSYAVPAEKIGEYLQLLIDDDSLRGEKADIVEAMLP
tara:strand:- start:145 stop:1092 length:948 start_codon:yes stop_codon:yes gene_type:complete